jgi:hypothetical protein
VELQGYLGGCGCCDNGSQALSPRSGGGGHVYWALKAVFMRHAGCFSAANRLDLGCGAFCGRY